MSPISFTPQGEQGLGGLRALLQRAVALDPHALARFQTVGAALNVFVTTPFDCIVARRVAGEISRDGAAVSAAEFWEALSKQTGQTVTIGRPQDASWPGALRRSRAFSFATKYRSAPHANSRTKANALPNNSPDRQGHRARFSTPR